MPSVSETTVPTLLCSAPASKFSIFSLMTELISEGLSCMSIPQLRILRPRMRTGMPPTPAFSLVSERHPGGETFQFAAQRAVNDEVAGADLRAADQRLIDHADELHVPAEPAHQRLADVLALFLARRHRGAQFRLDGVLGRGAQDGEFLRDGRQGRQAAVLRQHAHEVLRLRIERLARRRDEHFRELCGGDTRILQQRLDFLEARDVREHLQGLLPRLEAAAVAGQFENGLGVGPGERRKIAHWTFPYSSFATLSSRSAWALASISRASSLPAPATASAATSLRRLSRAREISCSICARAFATRRSPSARACCFASSTISLERRLAWPSRSAAWLFASSRILRASSRAVSRWRMPFSAAARPSAIVF